MNFYLSIDSFGLLGELVSTADIIYYARSPRYDSIEINFGTLYKRTTAVVSCLVDIFMTILLLLEQTLFKHIGDAKGLQILVEVPR
jgi:hypothetical protein